MLCLCTISMFTVAKTYTQGFICTLMASVMADMNQWHCHFLAGSDQKPLHFSRPSDWGIWCQCWRRGKKDWPQCQKDCQTDTGWKVQCKHNREKNLALGLSSHLQKWESSKSSKFPFFWSLPALSCSQLPSWEMRGPGVLCYHLFAWPLFLPLSEEHGPGFASPQGRCFSHSTCG